MINYYNYILKVVQPVSYTHLDVYKRQLYKDDSGYKRNKEDLTMSSYASNIMDLLWHQRENRNVDDKFHMITSLKGKFDFHKNVFLVLQGGIDYTDIEYNQKARVTQAEPNVVGGKY